MKLFTFSFKGISLGGEIVVAAGSEATARKKALLHLETHNTAEGAEETLELDNVAPFPARGPVVVHFSNGDY